MEEKTTKKIKFMNLIVLILIILIVVALVVGTIIKGKKQQQRLEQYQKQFQAENYINKGE